MTVSVVVSDTSPIRALDWIGHLDLLQHLYGKVIVPKAVSLELLSTNKRFRPIDLVGHPFIEVRSTSGTSSMPELDRLDRGEAEALRLAVELSVNVVLMDETAGRRAAASIGLGVVGTVGVLLNAKEKSLIDEVAPLVEELRSGLGFFLSDVFVERVLRIAGESE